MESANRLRRHADYQKVYKRGRKYFAKHMSYFFTVRETSEMESGSLVLNPVHGPRVGLTVGRVMGNAVTRNRIKRRLRAAVRQHIALLDHLQVDIALHPKKSVVDMAWHLLEQDVANVFRTITIKVADAARRQDTEKVAGSRA